MSQIDVKLCGFSKCTLADFVNFCPKIKIPFIHYCPKKVKYRLICKSKSFWLKGAIEKYFTDLVFRNKRYHNFWTKLSKICHCVVAGNVSQSAAEYESSCMWPYNGVKSILKVTHLYSQTAAMSEKIIWDFNFRWKWMLKPTFEIGLHDKSVTSIYISPYNLH